jgi:D-sedoheptulose 7-phosphate isomerase
MMTAKRMSVLSDTLTDHIAAVQQLAALEPQLSELASDITESIGSGGKLMLMGNGGSAADCQHIAAELTGRFERERMGLPAIALTTDTSALTAIANDYGFDRVFARQVEALARPGDIVVGLSTSGNSVNIVEALREAKARGCTTWGFAGRDGGAMKVLLEDRILVVPSRVTARIQECHILLGHVLCDLVERASLP